MKRITLAGLLTALLVMLIPAQAEAGSNNGTNNWYVCAKRTTTGGNLEVCNYDVRGSDGTVWQEYHYDADRAGGVGTAPKVYFRLFGTSTWRLLPCWNDCFTRMADQWDWYDWKATFADGSSVAIGAL